MEKRIRNKPVKTPKINKSKPESALVKKTTGKGKFTLKDEVIIGYPDKRPNMQVNENGWLDPSNQMYLDYFVNQIQTKCKKEKRSMIIFEFGSYMGLSSNYIAGKLGKRDKLYCVDLWYDGGFTITEGMSKDKRQKENAENLKQNLYNQFIVNTWKHRNIIIPVKMDGRKAMNYLFEKGIKPDLIYLDMDHEFEPVYGDLRLLFSLFPITPIIGDDYFHHAGVKEAVDKISTELPQYHVFSNKNIFAITLEKYISFNKLTSNTFTPHAINFSVKTLIILHDNFNINAKIDKNDNRMDAYVKMLKTIKQHAMVAETIIFTDKHIKYTQPTYAGITPNYGFVLNNVIYDHDKYDNIVFLDINYDIIDDRKLLYYILDKYDSLLILDSQNKSSKQKYPNSFLIPVDIFKFIHGFDNFSQSPIMDFMYKYNDIFNNHIITTKLFKNSLREPPRVRNNNKIHNYESNYSTILRKNNMVVCMFHINMFSYSIANKINNHREGSYGNEYGIFDGFHTVLINNANLDALEHKLSRLTIQVITDDTRLRFNKICALKLAESMDMTHAHKLRTLYFIRKCPKNILYIGDEKLGAKRIPAMKHIFPNSTIDTAAVSKSKYDLIQWQNDTQNGLSLVIDNNLNVGGCVYIQKHEINNAQHLHDIFRKFNHITVMKHEFPFGYSPVHGIFCSEKLAVPHAQINMNAYYEACRLIQKMVTQTTIIYEYIAECMNARSENKQLVCGYLSENVKNIKQTYDNDF